MELIKTIFLIKNEYAIGSSMKLKIREFLTNIGYKLKYGNVMFEGNIYEDWFTL